MRTSRSVVSVVGVGVGALAALAGACSSFQDSPVHRAVADDTPPRVRDVRDDGDPVVPTCGSLCEEAGITRCVLAGTTACFTRCEAARQAYDGCRLESAALLACLVREPSASCAVQGAGPLEGGACDEQASALLACVCLGDARGLPDGDDDARASCEGYCEATTELACRDEACLETCEAKLSARRATSAAERPWVECVAAQEQLVLECASSNGSVEAAGAEDVRMGPRPSGERCGPQHRAARACSDLVGTCVCDEAGCASDCAASACIGDAPDAACRACLETTCLAGQGYFLVGEPFD